MSESTEPAVSDPKAAPVPLPAPAAPVPAAAPVRSSRISEGLILAALPVTAYGVTYWYEMGYADELRIPHELISPSATNVFFGGIAVLVSVAITLLSIELGNATRTVTPHRKSLRPLLVAAFLIASAVTAYQAHQDKHLWTHARAVGVAIVALLGLGFTFVEVTPVPGLEVPAVFQHLALTTLTGQLFTWRRYAYVALSYFVLNGIYTSGQSQARTQDEFPVVQGAAPAVVLRIYGTNMVTAPLDRVHHTIDGTIVVRALTGDSTDPRPVIKLEKVGPLHVP